MTQLCKRCGRPCDLTDTELGGCIDGYHGNCEPTPTESVLHVGVWLGCAKHPDGYTCWVRKGDMTWLWCNECRGPLAYERDSDDLSIPARRAANRVVEHWEDYCFDHPSAKDWDFTEEVGALRDALAQNDGSGS